MKTKTNSYVHLINLFSPYSSVGVETLSTLFTKVTSTKERSKVILDTIMSLFDPEILLFIHQYKFPTTIPESNSKFDHENPNVWEALHITFTNEMEVNLVELSKSIKSKLRLIVKDQTSVNPTDLRELFKELIDEIFSLKWEKNLKLFALLKLLRGIFELNTAILEAKFKKGTYMVGIDKTSPSKFDN